MKHKDAQKHTNSHVHRNINTQTHSHAHMHTLTTTYTHSSTDQYNTFSVLSICRAGSGGVTVGKRERAVRGLEEMGL